MSYGITTPYGLGAYGSTAGPLSLTSAVAIATTIVRVTLTTDARHESVTGEGDALNPATWEVQRTDNGFQFTITQVVRVGFGVYDVHVLEHFGSALVQHSVAAPALVESNGDLVVAPAFASFFGILADAMATPAAIAASRRFVPRDAANPPGPQGASPGGTLIMTSAGDYANVSGAELVRKLIARRITTPKGGFFHLPDYGIGIRLKEPLPSSDLIKLRTEIERQALLESEVEAAQVSLTLTTNPNVLTILVRARLRKTGEQVETSLTLPDTTVSL